MTKSIEARKHALQAHVQPARENKTRFIRALLTLLGWTALRAKIGPDEAEPEGFGGSKVEGEYEVWPDFGRNPQGRGRFSRFRCRSSLADARYASLLAPRTRKNRLPSPPSQ